MRTASTLIVLRVHNAYANSSRRQYVVLAQSPSPVSGALTVLCLQLHAVWSYSNPRCILTCAVDSRTEPTSVIATAIIARKHKRNRQEIELTVGLVSFLRAFMFCDTTAVRVGNVKNFSHTLLNMLERTLSESKAGPAMHFGSGCCCQHA